MKDENAFILQLLTERQEAHRRERGVKQLAYEHLGAEIAELDERIDAINLVITKELIDTASDTRTTNEQARLSTEAINEQQTHIMQYTLYENGNSAKEKEEDVIEQVESMGLKETARTYFDELPSLYSKKDVAALLLKKKTDLTTINDNTLSGVMRNLVDKGLAKVRRPASGKSKQIYEKI